MKTKKQEKPWGGFNLFTKNKKSTVKILEILPREELSLQKHFNREEIWHFLTPGIVQIGKDNKKDRFNVKKNQTLKIPKKTPHRIIAKKSLKQPVRVLEISLGKFSEKDEKRLEDKYKR